MKCNNCKSKLMFFYFSIGQWHYCESCAKEMIDNFEDFRYALGKTKQEQGK